MPTDKPNANRLDVDLTVAADARVGVHRLGVVTPLGVPDFVAFAVEAHPTAAESEPNDDPVGGQAGRASGHARRDDRQAGRRRSLPLRGESRAASSSSTTTGKSLGSTLRGVLTLLDDQGRTIAEAGRATTATRS